MNKFICRALTLTDEKIEGYPYFVEEKAFFFIENKKIEVKPETISRFTGMYDNKRRTFI